MKSLVVDQENSGGQSAELSESNRRAEAYVRRDTGGRSPDAARFVATARPATDRAPRGLVGQSGDAR
ncbi:hypothetical protein [Crateriforma spongiae]|uniref:hypothetical protein n=1 Tax=Crateriforma spongiae TaxID=2724528 RepID=UPI0014481CC2|nr:hypothetical protein [Crateriforma spongiae]